jgi:hypothetical protein
MARAVDIDAEPADEMAGSAALLRPNVADALATAPGPGLMAAVLSLMADGHDGQLSPRERLEVVAAWDRIEAFARAGKLTAIGDLDTALHPDLPDLGPVSVRPTANELAPVLRVAPRTASALVALTRRARALPAAMDAMAEGRLIPGHLDVLDQVTRDTHPSLTKALEAEAIACARRPRRVSSCTSTWRPRPLSGTRSTPPPPYNAGSASATCSCAAPRSPVVIASWPTCRRSTRSRSGTR